MNTFIFLCQSSNIVSSAEVSFYIGLTCLVWALYIRRYINKESHDENSRICEGMVEKHPK